MEESISLLIVDDEEEIREGISRMIPWADHGICLAALAANGREAWQCIQDLHPDLMLLDIRMPVMNGLELLEKTAALEKRPRAIILSGFDDFSYCQKAIKLGATDYLLKPCQPTEILAAVLKLKEAVLTARIENAFLERLRGQFRENLELLREKLILCLVGTEQPNLEVGHQKWFLYEMDLPPVRIGVAVVRIQRQKYSGEALELNKLMVRNLTLELLREAPRINCFSCDHNDDLLILWENDAIPKNTFKDRMEQLRRMIENRFDFVVTVGIGETAATLAELCYAYQTALQAVEYSFWAGANRILDCQEIESLDPAAPARLSYPAAEEAAILQSIRTHDSERFKQALADFFLTLTQDCTVAEDARQYAQRILTALICSVYHVCVERGLDCDKIFGPGLKILDELNRLDTLEAIKTRLDVCFQQILNQTPVHKSSWKVVIKAMQYMDEHFREDLSLETVAGQVFISPGYLSTLFKQELQKNFVDTLHEIRVARAKEILRQTRVKVYEVAANVGYHDEKYFSQIFKKITGMTPNQYREAVTRE